MDVQINDSERRGLGITHLIGDSTDSIAAYNTGCFGSIIVDTTGTTIHANGTSATSAVVEFAIPIPSALVGTLASKALPVGSCGASSIYIEFQLATVNQAFVCDVAAAAVTLNKFTLSQVYYNAKMTTLPSDVNNALLAATGGIINLPAVSFKADLKTINAGATTFSDKFAFQYSSVKSFYYFVMNQTVANGGALYRSIIHRPRANISEFYLTINGEAYPSQPVTGSARMYAELLRSWDQLTDTNAGGIINNKNYNYNTHTAADGVLVEAAIADYGVNTPQARFIAGLDLDRFNHTSETLLSGTATTGQLINLYVTFSAAITANEPLNLYAYVMHDILYNIENGVIMPRV
jgi:hypothetical protein